MLISVDFWQSMHGFAMDSRTRGHLHGMSVNSWDRSLNCQIFKDFFEVTCESDCVLTVLGIIRSYDKNPD